MTNVKIYFFDAVCVLLLSSLLVSCTQVMPQEAGVVRAESAISESYTIVYPEDSTFYFSGKGPSAGMMMSSSMGAMGIAIGVAIDVGIGKKIYEAFVGAGYSMRAVIDEAITSQFVALPAEGAVTLHVSRVSFVLEGASEDKVRAEISGEVSYVIGVQQHIQRFEDVSVEYRTALLSDLQVDGHVTKELLSAVVQSKTSAILHEFVSLSM